MDCARIDKHTTVGQVLMNFPQLYMPLMELGL